MIGLICREDCPCEEPPPTCDVLITVTTRGCKGMGFPVAGVTFRVKDGGTTIDSGVSDVAGEVVLTVPGPTFPYALTIEWDAAFGFAAGSQAITLTACVDRFIPVQLVAASTHVCVASCCNFPVAKTLYLTTAGGSATLTWSGGATWAGSLTFSAKTGSCALTNCACVDPLFPDDYGLVTTGTGSLTTTVSLSCVSGGWRLGTGAFTVYLAYTGCGGGVDYFFGLSGVDYGPCSAPFYGVGNVAIAPSNFTFAALTQTTCDGSTFALTGAATNGNVSYLCAVPCGGTNPLWCGFGGDVVYVAVTHPFAGSITVDD